MKPDEIREGATYAQRRIYGTSLDGIVKSARMVKSIYRDKGRVFVHWVLVGDRGAGWHSGHQTLREFARKAAMELTAEELDGLTV